MAIIIDKKVKKTEKLTILSKKRKYFCPFCKIFFIKRADYSKINTKYKSNICNCKKFKEKDYSQKRLTSYHFKIDVLNNNEFIERHLKFIILKLWNQNYTHRDIHQITHLSRTMINGITKNISHDDKKYTVKEFLLDELNVDQEDYISIFINNYYTMKNKDNIIKLLIEFGCSVSFIRKLMKVSNSRIRTGRTYVKNCRYEFILENDTIIKRYKKNNIKIYGRDG